MPDSRLRGRSASSRTRRGDARGTSARPRGRWALVALWALATCVGSPSYAQGARLDAGQADAFVRAIFGARDVSQYDPAADAYLRLLAFLDSTRTPDLEAVLLPALRQLSPIVPSAERAAWTLDVVLQENALDQLAPGTGAQIVRWWNAQDDLPATPGNERLHEHLTRVAFALDQFASDDAPGWDDRGDIYVRLGSPDERREITVNPSVAAFDLEVPRSWTRVPDNEVWTYRHIARGLHYVFVRPSRRRPFRLAPSSDLVPLAIRNAGQGRGRLDALLLVMEEVYGQLALMDQAYGSVLDEVSGLIGGGSFVEGRPTLLAQSLLSRTTERDAVVSGLRADIAPTAFSLTRDGTDDLPAAIRWARLREPDGSTRLSVQWGLEDASSLRPSRRLARLLGRQGVSVTDDTWVSVSLARRTPDGAVGPVVHRHARLTALTGAVTETVELPVLEAATFSLQWQGRMSDVATEPVRPGMRTKLGTRDLVILAPLPTDGLVLSDLQPFVLEGQQLVEHPFAALPDGSLVVSFEVYGLTPDENGQVQGLIEYGIAEPGGTARATSGYEFASSESTLREQTEVDIASWRGQPAEITIRVEDAVTGAVAERRIAFLAP